MPLKYQGEAGDVKALAMKKWFNTNYHYMVPEIDDSIEIKLAGTKPFDEFEEAKALGVQTKPVIIGAYPEGHIEAKDIIEDIQNLKIKVESGADHLISQLFFNNDYFYSFRERCQLAGINVPIEAGIMPVVNKRQIERMTSLCGASVPKKFAAMMERYENNPIAMRDAGIAYAIDQIVDLITQGVDGIHLYTMNNPYIARKIYEAIHSLRIKTISEN